MDASAEVNPLIPQRRASIFRTQKDNSYRGWELGEVTEVLVERRPGGAILRVTGVADQQNAFAVKLIRVEEESDDSTVTFALKAVQAQGKVGTEASRSVTAALWMTDHQLEGVREIRVKAKRNVRAVRR